MSLSERASLRSGLTNRTEPSGNPKTASICRSLHRVATIGLQGCRSRVDGKVVDAAPVCVNGRSGPQPVVATDLMYDVPATTLAAALEPLVLHLPR